MVCLFYGVSNRISLYARLLQHTRPHRQLTRPDLQLTVPMVEIVKQRKIELVEFGYLVTLRVYHILSILARRRLKADVILPLTTHFLIYIALD